MAPNNNSGPMLAAGLWHGRNLAIRSEGGLKLAENIYPSGYRTSKHSHQSTLFNLVLDGAVTQTYARKTLESYKMAVVGLAPGDTHADCFHDHETRIFIIEISNSWTDKLITKLPVVATSQCFRGGAIPWLAMRLYNEFQQPDQFTSLSIEGLALELIAETRRVQVQTLLQKKTSWLTQTEEMVRERFTENLTLKQIAQTVGIHPVHLARGFRSHFGCTIGEYVRQRRIDFASNELLRFDVPISEIALRSGFWDQAHFSRTFKRVMGITPSTFRALFRKR